MARALKALMTANLVMAVLAGGCKQQGEKRGPPKGQSFSLLDRGLEPRKKHRYPISTLPPQKLALSLSASLTTDDTTTKVSAVAVPGLRFVLEINAKATDGILSVSFVVADADLTNTESAHTSVLTEMSADVERLMGMSGSFEVDERGFVSGVHLDAPDNLSQAMSSFVQSLELSLPQMTVPLPEESIGVGAKWQQDRAIEVEGLRVNQKTFYQLVSTDEGRALIRTETVQNADRQQTSLGGLPSGANAEVVSLSGSGRGEIELDAQRLAPSSLRDKIAVDITFAIIQGQGERIMSLSQTSSLEIQAL